MVTYPNQKIITIMKSMPKKNAKNDPYAVINIAACKAAMNLLSQPAFKLYMYLMFNQDGYELALSPKAVKDAIGLSETSYRAAIKNLEEVGYIHKSGEQYLAFDVPNGEKRELNNLLKIRKERRKEKAAKRSATVKEKRAAKERAVNDSSPIAAENECECIGNRIHENSDAEKSRCENQIHDVSESDTYCTENEIHTVSENGYRNNINNKYNINNIYNSYIDNDDEQSEASILPSGNKHIDDVIDDLLNSKGRPMFMEIHSKPVKYSPQTIDYDNYDYYSDDDLPF